ncbi:MAG: peptidylprolyl isomerase [Rhodothermia bacterium]|nr:peptidylprolyl isomerase [Rhodothermia bacterium]
MSKYRLTTSTLVVIALLPACRSQESTDLPDPVLATANGVDITRSWFESSYVNLMIHTGENDTPAYRYIHLDNMIDNILLEGEAKAREMDEDSSFKRYEVLQTKKALGWRFLEETVLEDLEPLSDREMRVAFERFKTKVVVRHLFYLDPQLAQEAYSRLQEGRSFLDEAQVAYGLAEYDSSAGFLGPMSYFETDDAFAAAAWSLDLGEYSSPVKSRFGYHIIRVENKVVNPIITESEYLARKEGIRQRERQRRVRLEGDRFVHEFMSGLEVRVNREAVAGLQLLIEELENTVGSQAVSLYDEETRALAARELASSLSPNTALASFVWRGDTYAFTVSDYLEWLPELTFQEARHRTAASVGRALRNEALSLEGFHRGLDDARTETEVRRTTIRFLSAQLRRDLRADTTVQLDEAFLLEAFERLGYASRLQTRATFWVIPFPSRADASRAEEDIEAGLRRPEEYQGFVSYDDRDLEGLAEWGVHARTAPLDDVLVTGLSRDRWFLLRVDSRRSDTPSFDDFRQELAEESAPYISEYRLIEDLRASAEIRVDTTLFEEIMTLE